MRLAPVLPAEMYALVDEGDYHWVQANGLDNDAMAAAVVEDWCRTPDDIVMLAGSDPDVLLRVATYLAPDEVVCPTVQSNAQATIAMAYDYIKDCAKAAKRVMLVPQGTNAEEWVDCYHAITDVARANRVIVTLGLAGFRGQEYSHRFSILSYLESLRQRDTRNIRWHAVHGIGVSVAFTDAIYLADEFPWIRGWSTVYPYLSAFYDEADYIDYDPTTYLGESLHDIWEPKITPQLVTRTAINIAVCRHQLGEYDGN